MKTKIQNPACLSTEDKMTLNNKTKIDDRALVSIAVGSSLPYTTSTAAYLDGSS